MDTNQDLYHEAGEPFVDGSSAYDKSKGAAGPMNGQYDEEYYQPINTGYVAWKDLGLELTLKAGNPSGAQVSSQYYPIDLPIPGDNSATGDQPLEHRQLQPVAYGRATRLCQDRQHDRPTAERRFVDKPIGMMAGA
jgi:hypothetical protein